MTDRAETRLRGISKAVIVVVLSVCASLVAAEGALRLLQASGSFPRVFERLGQVKPPLDTRSGAGMYYVHPYSAYALKPGYVRGNVEQINALGFRGEEVSLEKPEDVFRIIAIGGSTTFAVYLAKDQSYPYFLQQELRKRLGTDRVEVLNAGLTGSTSAESLHRLFWQILPAQPDMVVIYHGYNDLLPRVFNDYQDDYYHFRRTDPNNPPGLSRFLIWRLALQVLNPVAFHENYDLLPIVWKIHNLPESDTDRMANFLNSSNEAFERNLDQMVTMLQANGIEPVLATFAIFPDIWHWNDYIPPYLWELGISENNESIRRVAERNGAVLVPFGDIKIGRWMYNDSIHMNVRGNGFKAEVFADVIAPIVAARLGIPYEYKTPPDSLTTKGIIND